MRQRWLLHVMMLNDPFVGGESLRQRYDEVPESFFRIPLAAFEAIFDTSPAPSRQG